MTLIRSRSRVSGERCRWHPIASRSVLNGTNKQQPMDPPHLYTYTPEMPRTIEAWGQYDHFVSAADRPKVMPKYV